MILIRVVYIEQREKRSYLYWMLSGSFEPVYIDRCSFIFTFREHLFLLGKLIMLEARREFCDFAVFRSDCVFLLLL